MYFVVATNHVFLNRCYIVDYSLRFTLRVVSQCLFNALNDKSRENDEMRACSKFIVIGSPPWLDCRRKFAFHHY